VLERRLAGGVAVERSQPVGEALQLDGVDDRAMAGVALDVELDVAQQRVGVPARLEVGNS